jgi:hypothetical protein
LPLEHQNKNPNKHPIIQIQEKNFIEQIEFAIAISKKIIDEKIKVKKIGSLYFLLVCWVPVCFMQMA